MTEDKIEVYFRARDIATSMLQGAAISTIKDFRKWAEACKGRSYVENEAVGYCELTIKSFVFGFYYSSMTGKKEVIEDFTYL